MSSPASHPGASEALARFVAGPHAGPAFDHAVQAARALVLAARAALRMPAETSKLASRALASCGPPLLRAFAAGTALAAASRAGARAHAPIVAAAVTSGEIAGRDEADVFEAIAIGREVAVRLERALAFDAPWDAIAVIAGVAAAAAAARAAALDAGATRHAIGLAATQAGGLGVNEGTAAGELASGKAAADAVEAALLARHGFTAAPAALEGRRGLAALMTSRFDEAALCDGLGHRWLSAAATGRFSKDAPSVD